MINQQYVDHLRLTHAQKVLLLEATIQGERALNRKLLWALGTQTLLIVAFVLVYVV